MMSNAARECQTQQNDDAGGAGARFFLCQAPGCACIGPRRSASGARHVSGPALPTLCVWPWCSVLSVSGTGDVCKCRAPTLSASGPGALKDLFEQTGALPMDQLLTSNSVGHGLTIRVNRVRCDWSGVYADGSHPPD